MTRYRTIVADPPWRYEEKLPMGSGPKHYGPASKYQCMNFAEIRSLPVEPMAEDNAHLYLWTTNSFLVEAHEVVAAWGFIYRTMLTWNKTGPTGLGRYFRGRTEHVLFGVRGELDIPPARREATIFHAPNGPHSAKPDAFYDLVERVSPEPRLEMFARRARFGWDYWGDESLGTAGMAA